MKDPDSTQFRNVEFCARAGSSVIQGEYNSKNSYGAYEGFERFYFEGGRAELADEVGGPIFEKCIAEMNRYTAELRAKLKREAAN